MFQPGDRVLIDLLLLTSILDTDATQTALCAYSILMLSTLKPFCVVAARPQSLFSDEYKIDSVVLTDCATKVPDTKRLDTADINRTCQQNVRAPQAHQKSIVRRTNTAKATRTKDDSVTQGQQLDKIIKEVSKDYGIAYVVRCYKYKEIVDSDKLPNYVP